MVWFGTHRALSFSLFASLGLGFASLSGCFDGSAADGLPCNADADCGIGVTCSEDPEQPGVKCCGGTCSSQSLTSGPSSTTAPGSSTTTSSGSSSDSSSTAVSSSSGDSDCGDEVIEGLEECDPPDDRFCSETCQLLCGNQELDNDELCDPGFNTEGYDCNQTCDVLTVLSWERGGDGEETSEAFQPFECPGGNLRCRPWHELGDGRLASGQYVRVDEFSDLDLDGGWPHARLRTREFDFPALLDSDAVVVALEHEHELNVSSGGLRVDYGVVRLVDVGGQGQVIHPTSAPEGGTIDCRAVNRACFVDEIAPGFCPETTRGLVGRSMGKDGALLDTEVPLSAAEVRNASFSLDLRLQYDCGNFTNNMAILAVDDAWKLEALSVTVTRDRDAAP